MDVADEVTGPTGTELAEAVRAVRPMVLARLSRAARVEDLDDVMSLITHRMFERLVLRGREGDNAAAYVWPVAHGIVTDHVAAVTRQRARECSLDGAIEDRGDGVLLSGQAGDGDALDRARHTIALIRAAVGEERWEQTTEVLTADADRSLIHRNTRAWVRAVGRVVMAAMMLADRMEDATDLDIAMECLPERPAAIILAELAGAEDLRASVMSAHSLSALTAKQQIERARRLLFHARVAYDSWVEESAGWA